MPLRRYSRAPRLNGGTTYGTSRAATAIYRAVQSGIITTRIVTLKGAERLDILAGKYYGDGTLWWVIAAASGTGWALQCPPGTVLKIPTNLSQVSSLIG